MEFHDYVVTYFEAQDAIREWPELAVTLRRVAAGGPQVWKLPLQAAQAVGADLEGVLSAVGAAACAQIAITLIDDLLDEDPHGLHHEVGAGSAANLASAFQALGGQMLAEGGEDAETTRDLQASYARLLGGTAHGQFLDAQNPSDEAAYWQMVARKSATFYGETFYLGARLGGASAGTAEALRRLWGQYGVIIQIHDDLKDCLASPVEPDWLLGRLPLPILFASQVRHPQQARFEVLRKRPHDPAALEEAQRILLECGAVSYCLSEIWKRYEAARALLTDIPLARPERLAEMLDNTARPVQTLLQLTGAPEAEVAAVLAAGGAG
ncbi:MAG: polyprenyl synthetase family protein [Chloroflexi bacterium]|nr:polyprenyl synthetase family protein [Chloroflexota bacterium]